MEQISQRDLRALLALIQELGGASDLDTFCGRTLSLLHSLIPCEMISYNEVNPLRGRIFTRVDPAGCLPIDGAQRFEPHIGEHPLISHYGRTGDGQAHTLSDFLSQRQFHQLGLYQEFFREVSVEHQVAITLPAPAPLIIGIALNRSLCDFSERDRLLLNLLRPHLVQAYRRAEAYGGIREALDGLERGMESEGFGLVVLNRRRAAPLMTSLARRWLTDYFGRPDERGGRLPSVLRAWISTQEQRLRLGDDVPSPAEPMVVERAEATLVVRFVPDMSDEHPALLVLEEIPREAFVPPPTPQLTPREVDVLRLVARGKTNNQIGNILETSHRTIHKHLEHIFVKLGVETRTAAAAWAYRNWTPEKIELD